MRFTSNRFQVSEIFSVVRHKVVRHITRMARQLRWVAVALLGVVAVSVLPVIDIVGEIGHLVFEAIEWTLDLLFEALFGLTRRSAQKLTAWGACALVVYLLFVQWRRFRDADVHHLSAQLHSQSRRLRRPPSWSRVSAWWRRQSWQRKLYIGGMAVLILFVFNL